ncbi:MAG: glycosyltransferase family 39 protein [Bryobacteraceae bacterium]|nr:glycosyltransferase family 39 protein [Bryobacteraceae bacterium]
MCSKRRLQAVLRELNWSRWPRKRFLMVVLGTGFLLRGAAVVALREPQQVHRPETFWDGVVYHEIAQHLVAGHGYVLAPDRPTRYWMPGFSLFLAAVYKVVGVNAAGAYLSLCLLGSASCLIAYLLGCQLRGETFGRMAAVLGALYVPHVYLATIFASENLYAVWVGLAAFFGVRYLKRRRWHDLVAAAVTSGLGVLTRPYLLLGVLLFSAWLLVRSRQRDFPKLAGPVYLLGTLAVLSPWVVRNYLLDGRVVVLTTGAGVTFHGSNNDVVLRDVRKWGTWIPTSELPEGAWLSRIEDEWVRDREHWRVGLEWAREHWPWQPVLMAARLIRFWLPDFDSPNRAYVVAQLVGYTPFLVVFLAAGCRWRRTVAGERQLWAPIHAFLLASVATAVLFWGSPRFRDGNAPLLMVYAALGAEVVASRLREQKDGARAAH